MTTTIDPRHLAAAPEQDRRWRRGVVLLGLLSAVALVIGVIPELTQPLPGATLGIGLTLWVIELLRTPRWPWAEGALLVAVGACGGVLNEVAPDSAGFLLTYFAAAAMGLRLPVRLGATALAVVLLVYDVGVLAGSSHVLTSLITDNLGIAFAFVVAAATRNARHEHARSASLLVQLEAARAGEAEAAALAERARLAREIHDILAHSLSGQVMSLEATRMLAERTGADPKVVTEVARAHRLAKSGLADIRRAIGAMRGDALPGPELLPELVGEARASHGVRATLAVQGTPHPLSAEAGLAVYRTAQEALTNTAKHAGRGATSALTLTWGGESLTLSARDTGHGMAEPMPTSGYGLTGLRERAELAGGTLEAGPTDDGFVVTLTLPYTHDRTLT